jgi:hypothetical protein
MFENRMAHVLAGDYTPLSAVDIFVKDLGLVLDTARASKFPLPLSATAHQMFMQASAGHGREDDSAVIKIFPGIELPAARRTHHPGRPRAPARRPGRRRARAVRAGRLAGAAGRTALPIADTQLVFHLAAAVSGECEADFDLGMRSNLDATRGLLEAARRAGHAPVFVFSSSVAVFGDSPEQRLPAVIEDTTLPTPQNSYGIQKFIGEQLVADFTRKGFVQGRNVRLMTVSVRPGKPNGAASSSARLHRRRLHRRHRPGQQCSCAPACARCRPSACPRAAGQ